MASGSQAGGLFRNCYPQNRHKDRHLGGGAAIQAILKNFASNLIFVRIKYGRH
ncbi:protein of unknown function [Maridesulfovibrio hydrothermalis AM13 = DSM 14728]|uniref:Uncharacterized protein n=1 Tax=Maridesulfovibrio hydrothermalis AM13 = DSM 14728 TaxID=1121451 RepID=L0RAE0_9BACT|nr:protein of unknown function [Maridesulfovibrio hydrothermalis AM13 = DSM 14728]